MGLKPLLKNPHDEIFTVKALAQYLNIPVSSIYNKTHLNEIPYSKVGHGLGFKKKDIDAWLQDSHVPSKDGRGLRLK